MDDWKGECLLLGYKFGELETQAEYLQPLISAQKSNKAKEVFIMQRENSMGRDLKFELITKSKKSNLRLIAYVKVPENLMFCVHTEKWYH